MKIKNFYLATTLTVLTVLLAANAAQAQLQRFVDVIGNPPYGSDPVSGVIGSGANPGRSNSAAFENGVQSKVNAVGATLTVASVSGSQSVGGNTINVDAAAADTVLAVINAPVDANIPAREALVVSLGGGSAAGQLAQSMQGLRAGDGTINPVILTGAVNSYNSYMKSLFDSSQATQRPSSELDALVQGLPAGQRATQAILGRLVEATR